MTLLACFVVTWILASLHIGLTRCIGPDPNDQILCNPWDPHPRMRAFKQNKNKMMTIF